jgi:superfamily II DNA or RNA helicase
MKKRYYQNEGIAAVLNQWHQGKVATLLEMATGTGKTVTFCALGEFAQGRTLVLVHREELINQAVAKYRQMFPHWSVAIEQGSKRASVGPNAERIVVASKDTLCKPSRLGRFAPDEFSDVIVDEGHHAVKKNATYWRILKRFVAAPVGIGAARLLFVTATVQRADGEALGGIIQSVAYRYPISLGIEDGYLVPIESFAVHVKDLNLVLAKKAKGRGEEKDIDQGALDRIMQQESYIHAVVGPMVSIANNDARRSAVVFMPNVASAKAAADIINLRYHGGEERAIAVYGEMDEDERKRKLAAFNRGLYQYVVNCDVLTEGWDSPRVSIVVPKPTSAWSKFAQMVGRGTRPWDGCVDIWATAKDRRMAIANSPKPVLTVLDPCGTVNAHRLRNVADIFAGVYSPEQIDVAREIMRRTPEQMSAQQALQQAREKMRYSEEERRAQIVARCTYGLTPVDLFDYFSVKKTHTPHRLYGKPATEGQVGFLERCGVRVAGNLKFWDAKTLIDGIIEARNREPATHGQRRVLMRFGYDESVTRGEAKKIIDELSKNGWKKPQTGENNDESNSGAVAPADEA